VTDPFDEERGVLNADGSPTAMYLPWRTMAASLRGTRCLGALELPNQTPNAVLAGPHGVVVALWNDGPIRERLCLGAGATAIDAWGRPVAVASDEAAASAEVQCPSGLVLVRGVPLAVAQWCLSLGFEQGAMASQLGAHTDAVVGVNTFGTPLNGRIAVQFPEGWRVEPAEWPLQLAAGESFRLPFTAAMPHEADPQRIAVLIRMELTAGGQRRQMAMPRGFRLEGGDLELDVVPTMREDGGLELEQILTNRTDPAQTLDLQCSLYIPGRIRQRMALARMGPGEDRRVYVIRDARPLRGTELWLRVEEVDGGRVLNRHLIVP